MSGLTSGGGAPYTLQLHAARRPRPAAAPACSPGAQATAPLYGINRSSTALYGTAIPYVYRSSRFAGTRLSLRALVMPIARAG